MLRHPFPFDPSYGHDLEKLLLVGAPDEPDDFSDFWQSRYEKALAIDSDPTIIHTGMARRGWKIADLSYCSTGGNGPLNQIRGWALLPESGKVEQLYIVLHGYGGRDAPDMHLPLGPNAAILFPCLRGISRSRRSDIPPDPAGHVLSGIETREDYVLGGCVDDVWQAVSAGLALWPEATGSVGLLGISFGGGIGAMALPWDSRIQRAHFNVPTFGNQPLRLTFPTVGSGDSVNAAHRSSPVQAELISETLRYHDAATAARHIAVPVHTACALFDPAVAPPGQFAVYNAIPEEHRSLFVLSAGHWEYPAIQTEHLALQKELQEFFIDL